MFNKLPPGLLLSGVLGALTLSGCVEDQTQVPVGAVRIGALLPFSGDLAASGFNLERPLLMAAETINANGGIDGREVSILTIDSNRYFGDPDVGFDEHQATLRAFLRGDKTNPLIAEDDRIIEGAGIDAVIGPLVPELSVRLAAEARRNNVAHMSANVTPESNVQGKCSFSLFPSFRVLGRVLGQKMREDGVNTAGIVYLSNDYNTRLQAHLELAFTSQGGTIVAKSPTTTGKESYVADIDNALSSNPDAIVLLAPPRLAAKIATQTLAAESSRDRVGENATAPLRWYLSPLLRGEDFPSNVPPGLFDSGIGVAPGVNEQPSQEFATSFEERWDAEPTLDAQYLFDTINVLLLALRASAGENSGVNLTTDASYASTCQNIEAITKEGANISWREAANGEAYRRVGEDLNYGGLSGPVEFDTFGNSQDGLIETWKLSASTEKRIETISIDSVQSVLGN